MARLYVVHTYLLDSSQAAGIFFGAVHARANAQLGLACQRILLQIQQMLRFTMQRIYSSAKNLGNDCADDAAALRTFG